MSYEPSVSCASIRACLSATAPANFDATTGIISITPSATVGQVLTTTAAGVVGWAASTGGGFTAQGVGGIAASVASSGSDALAAAGTLTLEGDDGLRIVVTNDRWAFKLGTAAWPHAACAIASYGQPISVDPATGLLKAPPAKGSVVAAATGSNTAGFGTSPTATSAVTNPYCQTMNAIAKVRAPYGPINMVATGTAMIVVDLSVNGGAFASGTPILAWSADTATISFESGSVINDPWGFTLAGGATLTVAVRGVSTSTFGGNGGGNVGSESALLAVSA